MTKRLIYAILAFGIGLVLLPILPLALAVIIFNEPDADDI